MIGSILLLLSVIYTIASLPQNHQKLLSPWVEKGKGAINLWFPKTDILTNPGAPEISAKAAYFIEIDSGQVLYQKNLYIKVPIASLVKIMTAIIALENKSWQDEIVVSQQAASMEPDSMLLKAGEELTVEELLYGVFLVSANDAAEALAESSTSSRAEFIAAMNKKAVQLGMKNTLFANPTGLEEDEKEQYSTAFDVVLMSRYAIKQFPHLIDISSSPHIFLPQTSTHQEYNLYSGINLLTTYPGVLGFKTGYTPEAGLTLVTLAKKGHHQVLGVLLGSQNRRDEARKILDHSFHILLLDDS